MLFVDDEQAQLLELDVLAEQPVGADDDIEFAIGHIVEHGIALLAGTQP